jgi:hypothetical protein
MSARRSRRGTVAVEFALIGPALLALSLIVLEGAWQALTGATLDIAAREASRFGATGAAAPDWLPPPAPASREEAVRRVVLHFGGRVIQPDRLTLSLQSYASTATIGQPDAGVPGAGGAGETVVYTLDYTQPFLSPLAAPVLGRADIVHRSTFIVRNEPFPPP